MKTGFLIFAFAISLLFQGCGMPMGNRINNGNVTVYYLEGVSQDKAIQFAHYWEDNGFIGKEKQTIQLEKTKKGIQVNIIEREIYQEDGLTIREQSMLQELERTLEDEVFQVKIEIQITDNTYRPIIKE